MHLGEVKQVRLRSISSMEFSIFRAIPPSNPAVWQTARFLVRAAGNKEAQP